MIIFDSLIITMECVVIVLLLKDRNIIAVLGWITALMWTVNCILLRGKK